MPAIDELLARLGKELHVHAVQRAVHDPEPPIDVPES